MDSGEFKGMELLQQIEETRIALLEEVGGWCQRQPESLTVTTRIPVDLYASVYEGAPRRFLHGTAVAGIAPEKVDSWLSTLSANGKAQRFFLAWRRHYDPCPATLNADNVLLAGPSSLRFRDVSLELVDLRIGELIKVHHFITEICSDIPSLLDHWEKQPPVTAAPKPQPRKRIRLTRLLNARRWVSYLFISRVRHSH